MVRIKQLNITSNRLSPFSIINFFRLELGLWRIAQLTIKFSDISDSSYRPDHLFDLSYYHTRLILILEGCSSRCSGGRELGAVVKDFMDNQYMGYEIIFGTGKSFEAKCLVGKPEVNRTCRIIEDAVEYIALGIEGTKLDFERHRPSDRWDGCDGADNEDFDPKYCFHQTTPTNNLRKRLVIQ